MNKLHAIDILSAVVSALTVLAVVPYEKDVLQLFPPAWAPYVAATGAFATVALRVLRPFVKIAEAKAEIDKQTPPSP